jgi:outer membrane protein TolC
MRLLEMIPIAVLAIAISGCAQSRGRTAAIEAAHCPILSQNAPSRVPRPGAIAASPKPAEEPEEARLVTAEFADLEINDVIPAAGDESEAPPEPEPSPVEAPPAPEAEIETMESEDSTLAATRQPIDLSTALMLTGGRSPQVAFAQARIAEAQAQLDRADALWLPSIRLGLNYNKHEGNIQDVQGQIIDTSRGAFYTGIGASAVGAASPGVPGLYAAFHTTDAIFQPRIAERETWARRSASRAAVNDSLLQTALAYQQLLRAAEDLSISRDAELRAAELARVTGEYARTGQGLESDADRARTELALRQGEVHRSEEGLAVASARLSELVRWDYGQQLIPVESGIAPIELTIEGCDRHSLVATALSHRPEVAESRYLVSAACERLEREKNAPLLPSLLLGMSYGGMGAGLGGDLDRFNDRFDFDAAAFWEVRNLGLGEAAARDEACARLQQSRSRELATLDRVAREVVESHAQVISRKSQMAVAQSAVAAAQASYDRNIERIENGQGLPIEVLQSIQALATSQREYLRAIADYNAAQFTLHRSLGWPVGP